MDRALSGLTSEILATARDRGECAKLGESGLYSPRPFTTSHRAHAWIQIPTSIVMQNNPSFSKPTSFASRGLKDGSQHAPPLVVGCFLCFLSSLLLLGGPRCLSIERGCVDVPM